MEKVLKIKSNLDKLNSAFIESWESLENNVSNVIDNYLNEIGVDEKIPGGGLKQFMGMMNQIMAIFKAYLDSEKDIV